MKKIIFLLTLTITFLSHSQTKSNPIIVLDSKIIGFMNDTGEKLKSINPDEISSVTVLKDSVISRKYGSEYGVIIITRKEYILSTFYENFIESNSLLKEKIKSSSDLLKIGIVSSSKSKNHPYDELVKYIYTNTINEQVKKITQIIYLNPEDSIKINSLWTDGAIEIVSEF